LYPVDYRVHRRVVIKTFEDKRPRFRACHPTGRTPDGDTAQRLTETL
jgi:glutathione S-transferase